MILELHGSMGDHVLATGIPEAYFKYYGEKTKIISKKGDDFWKTNPYITDEDIGDYHSLAFNQGPKDYMIYNPVRVFYDITGYIVNRKEVAPNLYLERVPEQGLVVINDQAGWPNRRGYRYFDELAGSLLELGYHIMYMRNDSFQDCVGQSSEKAITNYTEFITNLSIKSGIEILRKADLYIGYDSGYANVAGALKVPYVFLASSVAPINTQHDSCIYTLDGFCKHCNSDSCTENCLRSAPNKNAEILEAIRTT